MKPDSTYMSERRIEPRMMCADLVDVKWQDRLGTSRKTIANLEDISASGACLQVDEELPLGTSVEIAYPDGELVGEVKYCVYREIGYFLGVEFEDKKKWNARRFQPQYMFDPRQLVEAIEAEQPQALPKPELTGLTVQ